MAPLAFEFFAHMTKQWPKLAIHGQAKRPADLGIMNKARTFFSDNGG